MTLFHHLKHTDCPSVYELCSVASHVPVCDCKSAFLLQSQCWASLLTVVNTACGSCTSIPAPSPEFLHVCISCLLTAFLVYFLIIYLFIFSSCCHSVFSVFHVRTSGSKGCCEFDTAERVLVQHTDPTILL